MKNKDLKASIGRAFSRAVPDVLDSVLSDCINQEGKVIFMTEPTKRNPWIKRIAACAAALVLITAGVAGYSIYSANYALASTVSLDVNPSIEIRVNKKERVLSVTPRNEDAKTVLGDMDFKGSDLDVTVNALIGSMLRNGYLSDLANSILISVDNDDPSKGQALQQKLTDEIHSLLQLDGFSGAVLSQTVADNGQLQQLADAYGITLGKAQLIQQIVEQNPLYQFEALVPLSINELNLLCSAGGSNPAGVASVGVASDKAYIGSEKAKENALSHAGLDAAQVADLFVEMDYDDGQMVYEVEFKADGLDYEYEINALTGAILKSQRERDDDLPAISQDNAANNSGGGSVNGSDGGSASDSSQAGASGESARIGEARAKEIALSHAGLAESDVALYKVKLDRDDGILHYEVEFGADGYEYDYKIDAATGAILKSEKDRDDDTPTEGSGNSGNAGASDIGEAKAKEIALSHAGLAESSVSSLKAERDRDNGVTIYEIEFKASGYEYDYEINAATGTIIKSEKDRDD